MPSNPRYLLNRDGRYFARIVIPKDLRPYLDGKNELRSPLGPDRRTAISRLHTAVAELQAQIAIAERRAKVAKGEAITPGRYPLPVDQIALRDYNERLALDDLFRNAGPTWANTGIDDLHVGLLRDGMAGKLNDVALERVIGHRIERYRLLGNTTVVYGSSEWRTASPRLVHVRIGISRPRGRTR
jgi:hypothetical protein